MTGPSPGISGSEESDVPPAVLCATCHRAECAGCEPDPLEANQEPTLAWEYGAHSVTRRLWRTALRSSTEPARVFGALPDGNIAPALCFALLAETVAVGSFGVVAVGLALAIAPQFSLRFLTHPLGLAYLFGGLGAATLTMVLLHAIWGACLEFGARSHEPNGLRQSLRFALYACGWDLLTSPAGLLEGITRRGVRRTFSAIESAVRAPRPALRAYQEERRHFEQDARRRGMRLSLLVLGALLLLLLPALGWAFISFAEWAVEV
jgi:hypothetical protein